MKVILITDSYPPDHTGAGNLAHKQAVRLLNEYDVRTDVVRLARNGINEDYSLDGIRVHVLPIEYKSNTLHRIFHIFTVYIKLNNYIKMNSDKYELVYGMTITWFTLVAILVSNINNLPCIIESTLYGDIIPDNVHKLPFIIFKTKELIKRNIMNMADAHKAYSPLLVKEFESIGINNVSLIPTPVDTNLFRPAVNKSLIMNNLGLIETHKYILFVGGICKRKGVMLLVEAFRCLSKKYINIHLLLVGPTKTYDKKYIDKITNYIANEKLSDLITFTEAAVDNVQSYMQASDVFVLPSENEGFGAVTVEAMACGLPVVVTNLHLISEFQISDGVDGFIVYDRKVETLANKIEKALKEANNANSKFSINARNKVIDKFSSKVVDAQLYCLYKKVVSD
jgi:glycosyltransferase involved in cell wall biosynthesis